MTATRAEEAGAVGLPPALCALLEELERRGIRWCLLRPRASLAQPDGDVDILVSPADLAEARASLSAAGFLTLALPGPDVHAAVHDGESGRFVWIHLQSALRLAGATVPAEPVLAEAAEGWLRQPADAWLLWILLLRALVDKAELPERHRSPVAHLAREWRGGPPELDALARRHGLEPAEVVAAAAAEDWEGLLRKAVHRPPAVPSRRERLARLAARLWGLRNLRERRGLSVAVIGPDGAGKTTLVEALDRTLPLPTRIQYMGLTGGLLPKADALRIPGLVLAARILILWLRYARSAYHRARGTIVLFDRYTLDGAVPSGIRLGLAGRVSRRLQRRVCPMPDLVLLLDASGTTMHARKGEYAPNVLETWRAAYGRLRTRVSQLEVIDAEQPVERVRRDAEALVWRRYADLAQARRRRA